MLGVVDISEYKVVGIGEWSWSLLSQLSVRRYMNREVSVSSGCALRSSWMQLNGFVSPKVGHNLRFQILGKIRGPSISWLSVAC